MNNFEDADYQKTFQYTTACILAQAVKRLFPETKMAIGQVIEYGFYYDFDREEPFSMAELSTIEFEMYKIVKANLPIEHLNLDRTAARQLMMDRHEPYKVELIDDLADVATISFCCLAEYIDLCSGTHLEYTGPVKALKLIQTAGAYWRGSDKNKMLNRIYGTSFPDKEQLNVYLEKVEEERKRDHNRLGRELGFLTTVDCIGQGLPILLPKGARVIQLLSRFVEDEEQRRGYMLTRTPFMAKSDLYKISGHWQHYREGMFILGDPEKEKNTEVLALRPMTCPFQFQAFLAKTRSYRDLPLRYNETSTLFRNEASGEMHGLIRIRQFTISEGHLMVTTEQLDAEFHGCLDLARFILDTLGLAEDVSYRFSKWNSADTEKYIGSVEQWDIAQKAMQRILDNMGINYHTAIGEAAFYGPKLDIQIRNVFGKEDTLITIQIDFQLAERFGMEYTDHVGVKKNPVIIHRTSIGCYERTLALLIEKYAGALPLWIAPEQARILPISERHIAAAAALKDILILAGIRVEVDNRDEKISKKIRDAQMDKVPYMLVLGDQEIANGTVAVRTRKGGDIGTQPVADLISSIREKIETRSKD